MSEINRSLILVKPKQPFLDWLHSIDPDDDTTIEDLNDDATAYLVPEFETDDEQEDVFNWCAEFVFGYELWSWCTDEALWPKDRDAATFTQWFDVEFHSIVMDVVHDIPLTHVDDEEDSEDIDLSSNGH
jgi:hypothetical protein